MRGERSMPHYRYLIVGAGMTGDAAVHGTREADPADPIGLIGAEPHPPYNRPPLTKGLWKDQSIEQIWRGTANLGAELHLGRRVIQLDKSGKLVVDDRGTVYTFDKLLLATGGRPRRLPFDHEGDRILYFRSLDDYQRLRELVGAGRRFAVIGGGFIGSEITAALSMNGRQVVMLFPDDGIGSRVFPAGLAQALNQYYREKGVEVLAGGLVAGENNRSGEKGLATKRGGPGEGGGGVARIGA